jgi:hypothetical protein
MLAHLATVIAKLPDLPSRDVGTDPKPYIALFGVGFLLAVIGHLFKAKVLIAAGILMVFIATVVLPLVASFNN